MRVENDLKLIRGTARSELIPIGHASCSPPSSYRLSTSSPPSSPPPRDNLRLCCSRPSTHATATRSWSIDESIEKTIERWEDDANASSANALSHYQSSSRPQTTHIVPSWPADEPLFREIDQTAFWRAKPPQALPFARPGSLSQSDEQPQVTSRQQTRSIYEDQHTRAMPTPASAFLRIGTPFAAGSSYELNNVLALEQSRNDSYTVDLPMSTPDGSAPYTHQIIADSQTFAAEHAPHEFNIWQD